MQEAFCSGRQQLQLVAINAQYMQTTCRIQIARALVLDQFQLGRCQVALTRTSKAFVTLDLSLIHI